VPAAAIPVLAEMMELGRWGDERHRQVRGLVDRSPGVAHGGGDTLYPLLAPTCAAPNEVTLRQRVCEKAIPRGNYVVSPRCIPHLAAVFHKATCEKKRLRTIRWPKADFSTPNVNRMIIKAADCHAKAWWH
jgi:hypothetical protein